MYAHELFEKLSKKKHRESGLDQMATGGIGVGGSVIGNALTGGTYHAMAATPPEGSDKILKALRRSSPVPIHNAPSAYYNPANKSIGLPRGGSAATLAHELGHAEIDTHPVGRLFQNNLTRRLGMASPMLGLASGAISGLSDDEQIQRMGVIAPAVAAAPMLASEGGASLLGLRRMARHGAKAKHLIHGAGTLLPAFGTYLTATGLGVGGAMAAQGGVRWLRDGVKEGMASFYDEMQKLAPDAATALLTIQ